MSKDTRKNLSFLYAFAWERERRLYPLFFLNILLNLTFTVALLVTPRALINEITTKANTDNILRICFMFLIVAGLSGFFKSYIWRYIRGSYQQLKRLHQNKIQLKRLQMDLKNYENPEVLDKFYVINSAVFNVSIGVQQIYERTFLISANALTLCFYLWILSYLNIWIVGFIAVNLGVYFYFANVAYKYEANLKDKMSPLDQKAWYVSRVMTDFFYGKDIRIFSLSNWLYEKLTVLFSLLMEGDEKIQRRHFISGAIDTVFTLARELIVYGFLVVQVVSGEITIADFTMYFAVVSSLTVTAQLIFNDVAFCMSQQPRITEYRKFLDIKDTENRDVTIPLPQSDQYEIEFRDITFSYPGTDRKIFENFSLTVKSGERLAIVGLNGMGKTTLIKLLLRFYDPDIGTILINGEDVRSYDIKEYRKLFSAVF